MRTRHFMLALVAVALAAYAAGRADPPAREASAVATQVGQEHGPQERSTVDAYRAAATPGERHRQLDRLAGDWAGEFTIWMDPDAAPTVSQGKVQREWILGGRFLRETVEARSEEGVYRGLGFIGYDNVDGQYEIVWMDEMSTGIYSETGTYHADTGIMHTRGSHRDPATGQVVNAWAKLDLSDADRHTYTGWAVGADGRVFKTFEGVLERAD